MRPGRQRNKIIFKNTKQAVNNNLSPILLIAEDQSSFPN
jgi:hypothetical protein